MKRSSKNRLNEKHLARFAGETLFDRIARTVCRAGCLPRKELYEAWEVARRVRRRWRGGRVVDLACGHGLLAIILLLLDDSSAQALAVDLRIPSSAQKLAAVFAEEWPRLRGRVTYLEQKLETVPLGPQDLVVSAHACGCLSDLILQRAVTAQCRLALLPCCQHLAEADDGDLQGWLDGPLAVDVARVARLRQQGYRVLTQRIPVDITPKNRLLLAEPGRVPGSILSKL
jgi:SAM-dependent methyltransferase